MIFFKCSGCFFLCDEYVNDYKEIKYEYEVNESKYVFLKDRKIKFLLFSFFWWLFCFFCGICIEVEWLSD